MAKKAKKSLSSQQRQDLKVRRHAEWEALHKAHEGPQKAGIVPSGKVYKRPGPGSKDQPND